MMTFEQYQLFEDSGFFVGFPFFTTFYGIFLSDGSTFANTTISFADAVTGGALLDSSVGNWVFSQADDTFTLGATSQNIDVGSGGADRMILDVAGGIYTGGWLGGSTDDTIQFNASSDISGINGGGLTTFRRADFNNANITVTMLAVQDNALTKPYANTGGDQTIVLTRGGGFSRGDAGIESYILTNTAGTNSYNFTVAKDQASLSTGKQNVTFANPGVTNVINFDNGTFTGTVSGLPLSLSASMTFSGNVDIKGVNGGAAVGATTAFFSILGASVTMTTAQHLGLSMVATTPQTITIADGGAVIGNGVIGNYVLVGGSGNAHVFTVAKDNGAFKQNVAITGTGANDTIRFGNNGTFTGVVSGLDKTADSDVVQFFGNADIKGVNGGATTGAKFANFSDTGESVTMTAAQHQGFTPGFQQTGGTQTITLATSAVQIINDNGIENYVFASGGDSFFVSADNGVLVGGKQNINMSSGGTDFILYTPGTFSGNLVGAGADDFVVFLAGPIDIQGVNGGAVTGAKVAIFNDTPSSVTMTVEQHNGFSAPFNTTGKTQTITLATSGTATGDSGIEQYVLASGDDVFTVAPDSDDFEQSVDIGKGGKDVILYGSPFSGNLTGAGADDTVQFLSGGGDVDISEVNGGAATGAGKASFSDGEITVSMTLAQHSGFAPPFVDTDGTQTIVLTTAAIVMGDAGIENYVVIGEGDYTFALAKDDVGLVGGSQNLDLVDPDVFNDTVVFGPGTFSGVLANAGKGDLVLFSGGATDISGLNGGKAIGAEHLGFNGGGPSMTLVDATLTVAQHNAFDQPFLGTAGVQTITLATDGTATGDIGIEQYILGEDKTNANLFTIGKIGQSVTGRSDDDMVVYSFGGPSGILLGGTNNAAGDTLILMAPNTVLAAGSKGFENLTLTTDNATVTMTAAAHKDFELGVTAAPGTGNRITLTDTGDITGLPNIESYQLGGTTGTNFFTFSDFQTGTVTGTSRSDNFFATAAQIAGVWLLDGGGNPDNLIITTDAKGLDLEARTANLELIQLAAGSTENLFGSNISGGTVYAFAATIFTMGSGSGGGYVGSDFGDDVTFSVGSNNFILNGGNDILRSKVGGAITAFSLDGGLGTDTLALTTGDDVSGSGLTNFEDLALANSATVTMTGAQYTKFATNSAAPGNETIVITGAGAGFNGATTFADIENYILQAGGLYSYTIAGSNQTVTDTGSSAHTATIQAGLSNVTLTTGTVQYYLTLEGGNTGLNVDLGSFASHILSVTGAGPNSGTVELSSSSLNLVILSDNADIAGVNLLASGGASLVLSGNADVTINAAQHALFSGGGPFTTGGKDSITIADQATGPTKLSLTATQIEVEAYFLNGPSNTIDLSVGNASDFQYIGNTINLAIGNGTDIFNINNGAAAVTAGTNTAFFSDTIAGFLAGADGDTMRLTLDGVLQTFNAGNNYGAVLAADLATLIPDDQIVILNSTILSVANPFAGLAAVDAVVDAWTAGNAYEVWADDDGRETVVINTTMGAAVYEVHHSDKFSVDGAQLIGVLSGVASDNLVAANFA